jgi:hypothetical protein
MESSETTSKRPQFGNRFLPQSGDNDDVVFQHNAWWVSTVSTKFHADEGISKFMQFSLV